MVRRVSKRRSKHALNSIHKSCKLQNNCFKCDELGKRQKNTYSPICQTLFPPDEHALYKHNFVTGNTFSPPEAALLTTDKKSAASRDERAGNGRTIKSKRSCRKSLLAVHGVMEMCRSCFINTKYNYLRCELPACNKCSVYKTKQGR